MLRGSLYGKLALALFVVLSALGLIYVGLMVASTRLYLQEVNQSLNRELAAGIAAEERLISDNQVNRAALTELFDVLMVVNPAIEVYLVDADGRIIGHAAPPEKVVRDRVNLAPIRRFIDGDEDLPIFGDDPRDPERRKIFTAAPILYEGRTEGFLYIVLGGETYDSFVEAYRTSQILRVSVWTGGVSIVLALVAGLVSFNWLTRRLRRLAGMMDALKRGDYREAPPDEAWPRDRDGDEIDRLGVTFEEMTERIVEQMDALRHADETRRDMVANISHDLRTPLAALQGYIDTLQIKDDTLSAAEKKRYMEMASKNTMRVGELIADLFELARLESDQASAHKEPCAINELVQDVAGKFALEAEERDIGLELEIPERAPFVSADVGLIERALENLIDNALKFTGPGGAISLSVEEKDGAVETRVSDTGRGIPEQQLPRIFDRFFRADDSQYSGRRGTGLGLAIVKRIIDLHGGSLQVASAVGEGTTFRFRLPIAEAH